MGKTAQEFAGNFVANVPRVIITRRALEIGVDRYMSKPYQETELLENIRTLLAERAKR